MPFITIVYIKQLININMVYCLLIGFVCSLTFDLFALIKNAHLHFSIYSYSITQQPPPLTLSHTKRQTNFRDHTTRKFFKDNPQIKLLPNNKTEKNFRGYLLSTSTAPHRLAPAWQSTMNRSAYLAAVGFTHLNQIWNRHHQHRHQHNDPKMRCY